MARGHHGEQSAANTSFVPAANEVALQSPGCSGPFATAGGAAGSEEHPSLTFSDCVSILFDEEYSPPAEDYYSAAPSLPGAEDYMSILFDEDYSPPAEEYYSAAPSLHGAGSEEVMPSLTVSDYIPMTSDEDYYSQLPDQEYYSAPLLEAPTGPYFYTDLFLPPAEDTGESSKRVGPTGRSLFCAAREYCYGGGVQEECQRDHKDERISKCVFRTLSEKDVLEDGYKWRKYGKKSVKNSPYKRNYYKCSAVGCGVNKRIERDRDDPSYVLTTYQGKHSHPPPPPGQGYYSSSVDDVPAASAPS